MSVSRTTLAANARSLAILLLVLGGASLRSAASITYGVDLTIGGSATATGDIITDGTTGALNSTEVFDWNLLLSDGANTVDLLGPLSGSNSIIQFNDLFGHENWTATATQMLYNFSQGGTSFVYFSSLPAVDGQATLLSFSTESILGPTDAEALRVDNGAVNSTALSGTQVIGTASSGPSTPEPSTLALLGGGIALLVSRKWRRKQRSDFAEHR